MCFLFQNKIISYEINCTNKQHTIALFIEVFNMSQKSGKTKVSACQVITVELTKQRESIE